MRSDLPSLLPLICPRCRTATPEGRSMHTLSLRSSLRSHKDDILEGELGCDNRDCGALYPILDGVPIISPNLPAVLEGQLATIAGNRDSITLARLAAYGPDSSPLARLAEHLSIYLDAHYGDRAQPAPDGFSKFGFAPFATRLARLNPPVRRSVELGSSVGRGVIESAKTSELAIGIELHFGAARAAQQLIAGHPLSYARRKSGRHYQQVKVEPFAPIENAAIICGDALDPPLAPAHFDRAIALNVIDSVARPAQLLSVLDGLLAPGGELILSSPYTWQSDIVEEAARPDTADPARWLRETLQSGRDLEISYQIREEAEIDWSLRRDDRSAHVYRAHYLRAEKQRRG